MNNMRSDWTGSNVPVTGIDGISPKRIGGRWESGWHINEIYFGKEGQNKYVPEVNDLFHDTSSGKVYIITSVDPVTFIPEYRRYYFDTGGDQTELLNLTSQPFVAYYDKSKYPYRLTIEGTCYIFSDEAHVARVYRGSLIAPEFVISRMYDNSGNFNGHDIPLISKQWKNNDTDAIKIIPTCLCEAELKNGEELTYVVYGIDGRVIKHQRVVVFESTYMAEAFSKQLYVEEIFLKSAFISPSNQDLINFPANYTAESFNPIGVVRYNDGTTVEYPVDGKKFSLSGLDTLRMRGNDTPLVNSFISALVSQKIRLMLRYHLSPGEAALGHVGVVKDVKSRPMMLKVVGADFTYGVKIFTYPEWVDENVGYRLKHYLLHIERNMIEDVTEHVRLSENSPSFSPKDYTQEQRLTLTLELSKVMSNIKSFKHVQPIEVVLRAPAISKNEKTLWTVLTQHPADRDRYGVGIKAHMEKGQELNTTEVYLGNDLEYEEWLERIYKDTMPLYNPETELAPPLPTHMEIRIGSFKTFIPVKDYKKAIIVPTNVVKVGGPVRIFFYLESGPKYLVLSMANMALRSR